MVQIEGDSYTMGCTPEQEGDCTTDENPPHEIRVSNFSIGKYEITQEEWTNCMGSNPSFFSGCSNCPVDSISWFDAIVFCNRISEQEGFTPCYYSDASFNLVYGKNGDDWELPNTGAVFWKQDADGYRLPTEAEWEFAARGGKQSQGFTYAGSNSFDEVAWWNGNNNGMDGTSPVGLKTPNELEIFDMSGNVWEWVWDNYDSLYYNSSITCNPLGPNSGSTKTYRGGAWNGSRINCRISNRFSLDPTGRLNITGFRVARGTPSLNDCPKVCSPSDSLALIELYNNTNGQNWVLNWNLNQPVSSWFGISLNENGCVRSINLNRNNLTGHLIDLNLPELISLNLANNQLNGGLAESLVTLPSLTNIDLSNNNLSGCFPESFSNFNFRVASQRVFLTFVNNY